MITDYASYIDYFRTLADEHAELCDFVYGGSQRILSREMGDLDYPVLWLEMPDIVFGTGNEDLMLRFDGGLMILQATPTDFESEDEALNDTSKIAISIIQRMIDDAEQGHFDFNPANSVLQAKPPFSGDNDFGWHIAFDITIPGDACLNTNDWI